MDPEIREAILGPADKTCSVRERYAAISDEDVRKWINLMTFEHGETQIWLASKYESGEAVQTELQCSA